jgi:hypothetical protein
MLEALVCTQDWLRRSVPVDIKENIEELTMMEQGTTTILQLVAAILLNWSLLFIPLLT